MLLKFNLNIFFSFLFLIFVSCCQNSQIAPISKDKTQSIDWLEIEEDESLEGKEEKDALKKERDEDKNQTENDKAQAQDIEKNNKFSEEDSEEDINKAAKNIQLKFEVKEEKLKEFFQKKEISTTNISFLCSKVKIECQLKTDYFIEFIKNNNISLMFDDIQKILNLYIIKFHEIKNNLKQVFLNERNSDFLRKIIEKNLSFKIVTVNKDESYKFFNELQSIDRDILKQLFFDNGFFHDEPCRKESNRRFDVDMNRRLWRECGNEPNEGCPLEARSRVYGFLEEFYSCKLP